MSEVFLKIVNMSISASWLVIAVLLLRLVLKKAPKWVNVLLWGFVAVRLICPFSFESALSVIPSAEPIPEQVISNLVVDTQTEIPQTESPSQDLTDAPARDEIGDPTDVDVTAPETTGIPAVTILASLWAVGVGVMLIYTAVSYFLLWHRVATAVRLKENIYRSENVDSPFVLGFLRPKIYLPFNLDGGDLAHVIAHEKAHIYRKDHWWKPAGFVLLAIHWFNPIMWVGYFLLCRDIELACDEKVIKEMDNETKADYTEALVACSVNRRRIAACPLAFGEVGVKERVKTVMNYKKPAFWIVIAAVALCIVVAVCFLTDPKDYGPEVGNPQMLELPGVAWFATPDEVKEALNITEDQILWESTTSGYVLSMDVTDITLFGRDVSFAEFSFWFGDQGDTELRKARVFFSENTNMNKLKQELIEIYGPGIDEPYRYDIYHDGTDLELSELEASARVEEQMDNLEGNPYRDALEDPNYMAHHWVLENGSSMIPEEVVEYLKSAEDENMPQDADAFKAKLDQMPWIVISMTNRHAGAIFYDATGKDEMYHRFYTNNYIEFNAKLLAEYLYTAQVSQKSQNTVSKKNPGLTTDQILADIQNEAATLAELVQILEK